MSAALSLACAKSKACFHEVELPMTTTFSQDQSQLQPSGSTTRHVFISALLAVASLATKMIHIRRSARSWLLFRIFLGVVGAALVLVPLTSWNSYVLPIAGLVLFVSSILLPPAKPQISAADKARELGAFAVVDGGKFLPMDASSAVAIQLFVGTAHISVLDANFQPLLEIPTGELTSVRAVPAGNGWLLELAWTENAAEFSYRGIFAEHLVHIAESALHRVMRPTIAVTPKRRAASA
jgi:hypothetical protein